MQISSEIRDGITRYLWDVAAHLGRVSSDERAEILQDLESHLYEGLRARAGETPTVDDLRALLAEMPAPASYAEGGGVAVSPEPRTDDKVRWDDVPDILVKGAATVCWEAVGAFVATLVAIGLIARGLLLLSALHGMRSATQGAMRQMEQMSGHFGPVPALPNADAMTAFAWMLIIAGVACGVAAYQLGLVGERKIRMANFTPRGLWMAVSGRLAVGLLLVDGLMIAALVGIFHGIGLAHKFMFLTPIGWLLPATLLVIMNIAVIRGEWRRARQAWQPAPEFTHGSKMGLLALLCVLAGGAATLVSVYLGTVLLALGIALLAVALLRMVGLSRPPARPTRETDG